MKNKKINLIIEMIVIFILLVIVGVAILLLLKDENIDSSKMDDYIRNMASNFYINYYYDDISTGKSKEEIKEYLEQFKDIGIKVSMSSLSEYDEDNNSIIEKFKKNGKYCDRNETKAIIYPISPYGKKDFSVESIIDCD